jgi:14-3-3 protein epsilon
MVEHMIHAMKMGEDMTVERRNNFSVAFKNLVGSRRAALRVIDAKLEKAKSKEDANKVRICLDFRSKVRNDLASLMHLLRRKAYMHHFETFLNQFYTSVQLVVEVNGICNQVIEIIERTLPNMTDAEHKTFFYKMLGDYHRCANFSHADSVACSIQFYLPTSFAHCWIFSPFHCRYLSEFAEGDLRSQSADNALAAYTNAQTISENELSATNPIRLGLFLNFSVFYFEIMDQKEIAIDLAKRSFDGAIAELDHLSEDSYKEATVIMQLLRENLCNWTEVEQREIEDRPADRKVGEPWSIPQSCVFHVNITILCP